MTAYSAISDGIGGSPPPADEEQRQRWREFAADSRRAQAGDSWLCDQFAADDYPGTPEVWRWLAELEDWMRDKARQPEPDDPPSQPETPSRIPARYRDPATIPQWLAETDAYAEVIHWTNAARSSGIDHGLLLAGPTGTGKTGLATMIARLCGETHYAAYWPARELLIQAKKDMEEHRRPDTIEIAARKPILVLDDLGVERTTSYNADRIGWLIETRHANSAPTVATTNLAAAELEQHLSANGHNRSYSRLVETTKELILGHTDQRFKSSQ
jgi:predicted ATPase